MSRKLNSSLKMEFESKKIIKLFLILLEWLTFGGLMIGVGFFVQEVWRDYQSHVTTIKQYSERFDATDPPTITFCFNPPIKTQVLEKYNLTIPQLLSHDETEKDSYILEEGFYKIGRDFNVTNRNNVQQHLGDNDKMRLEEIYTFWNGICTKVSPMITFKRLMFYGFVLELSEQIEIKHFPKVDFFLTSEQNAYDIILSQWTDGNQPLQVEADLKEKVQHDLSLQIFNYKKLEIVSNCSYVAEPSIICGAQR